MAGDICNPRRKQSDMLARIPFILKQVNEVSFEQRPERICGSDVSSRPLQSLKCASLVTHKIHYLDGGDMVLGRESSGVVSAGTLVPVTHLKPGDRVAIEPGATCRKCEACKEGRYQLCPEVKFAPTPPYAETLSRYYAVPADLAYPLPPHLTLEDGAMVGTYCTHSTPITDLPIQDGTVVRRSIAVFCCGPVGSLWMAVAKALGASRVIAVDIVPGRLESAKSYVATDVFLPPPMEKDESRIAYSKRSSVAMKEQLDITERGTKAIDLVVDASGAEVSIQAGPWIAKIGETYVQVGMGPPDITIDVSVVLVKELVMKGSFRYGDRASLSTSRTGKSSDGKGVIKAIIAGPDVDINAA
ncbi:chaperonin 10-like protein [Phlebopus sp. FC_14]|nr:chaperonin 10-like protein [Phlebopus sp. FC_14]